MRFPEFDRTRAGAVDADGDGEGEGSAKGFWLCVGEIETFSKSSSTPIDDPDYSESVSKISTHTTIEKNITISCSY